MYSEYYGPFQTVEFPAHFLASLFSERIENYRSACKRPENNLRTCTTKCSPVTDSGTWNFWMKACFLKDEFPYLANT